MPKGYSQIVNKIKKILLRQFEKHPSLIVILPKIKMKKISSFCVLIILVFSTAQIIISCSHYDIGKKVSMTSKIGDDESHSNGENCMNCHATGGKGEGWFDVAGSVYKANKESKNPNGKILLYSQPNGQGILKYIIEVDGEGNFYTTETINFEKGLYPAHQNTQGVLKYMEAPIITGQCQSCHNVTTDKIWND